MNLTRPLVFFDLETTGPDASTARIVQIACVKRRPDGTTSEWERLINPGCPIPPEATAVHGITDAMVASAPTFEAIAPTLLTSLAGCDLGGFNVRRYDIPLLQAEFARVGMDFAMTGRAIVDAMALFHFKEKRDLSAAVRFYCGREIEGAHNAMADVKATIGVFNEQLARYSDLPSDVAGLHDVCAGDAVDLEGKFAWKDGEATLTFGKNKGRSLKWLAANDASFLRWTLGADFGVEVKHIIKAALAGQFPSRKEAAVPQPQGGSMKANAEDLVREAYWQGVSDGHALGRATGVPDEIAGARGLDTERTDLFAALKDLIESTQCLDVEFYDAEEQAEAERVMIRAAEVVARVERQS